MYTSIVLVALAGSAAGAEALPESVLWKDYATARKIGRDESKPVAVFIGQGAAGWQERSREGALSRDVTRLLRERYVCVYVDTATAEGKKLAAAFEMDAGVVLSTAQGDHQAFRKPGSLTNEDLAEKLRSHVATETVAPQPAVIYNPAVAPPVNYIPAGPAFGPPAFGGGFSPGFGGGAACRS